MNSSQRTSLRLALTKSLQESPTQNRLTPLTQQTPPLLPPPVWEFPHHPYSCRTTKKPHLSCFPTTHNWRTTKQKDLLCTPLQMKWAGHCPDPQCPLQPSGTPPMDARLEKKVPHWASPPTQEETQSPFLSEKTTDPLSELTTYRSSSEGTHSS